MKLFINKNTKIINLETDLNTIKLDYDFEETINEDSKEIDELFNHIANICFLIKKITKLYVSNVSVFISNYKKGLHVYLNLNYDKLDRKLTDVEKAYTILIIQSMMLSDIKREMFNLSRLINKKLFANALFTSKFEFIDDDVELTTYNFHEKLTNKLINKIYKFIYNN